MSLENSLTCFKTYDVRGKLGDEIDGDIVYRIGRAVAQTLKATSVVVGFDTRQTSNGFASRAAEGINDSGADVFTIGLSGTEEMYFAVSEFRACAGIMITASHNPIDYNGMKVVKQGSRPLSGREFANIRLLAEKNKFLVPAERGSIYDKKSVARELYLKKITAFIDVDKLKPFRIVINSGNGTAGPVLDELKNKLEEKNLKTNFLFVNHEPDPTFPNGIPNPLIKENQLSTSNSVIREKAEFGVAFDGDFDRCFLFDHLGNFIPGEYLVGLLAEVFLKKEKGAKIIHDPRVIWNIKDIISNCGGHSRISKTGHSFVKGAMRDAGAIYGGEISAHHYFRDFFYCDSGMIPWLLIWELISKTNLGLFQLISERKKKFPSSGEINFKIGNGIDCLQAVKNFYVDKAIWIGEVDGLSMSFKNWRFNLRSSNTEPLVRLNVETRGDELLLKEKTEQVSSLILRG